MPTSDGVVEGHVAGHERLELLRDGAAGFEQLCILIDAAKADLQLLFYTFASDSTGEAIRNRLIAACKRGVEVTLIVDDFGSIGTPRAFFEPLTECGCKFHLFLPRLFQRYLLRNHQKFAVADQQTAIIGSFNVSDEHMQAGGCDTWHDIGVYIEGPAALRLSHYFDVLASWVANGKPRMRRLGQILERANEHSGAVRWVFGGPSRGYNNYVRQVRHELRKANSTDMIMAYFTPSPSVLSAVRRLASDGRFRLIAAKKTDVMISRAAAWHTYWTLLHAGAQIYEYRPRVLHSKLIIVDDVVFIGSGNFDVRSLYVNLEIMLRVEREDFVREVRAFYEEQLADSDQIDLATLNARRKWYKRIWWRTAYFLVTSVDRFLSRRFAR